MSADGGRGVRDSKDAQPFRRRDASTNRFFQERFVNGADDNDDDAHGSAHYRLVAVLSKT